MDTKHIPANSTLLATQTMDSISFVGSITWYWYAIPVSEGDLAEFSLSDAERRLFWEDQTVYALYSLRVDNPDGESSTPYAPPRLQALAHSVADLGLDVGNAHRVTWHHDPARAAWMVLQTKYRQEATEQLKADEERLDADARAIELEESRKCFETMLRRPAGSKYRKAALAWNDAVKRLQGMADRSGDSGVLIGLKPAHDAVIAARTERAKYDAIRAFLAAVS